MNVDFLEVPRVTRREYSVILLLKYQLYIQPTGSKTNIINSRKCLSGSMSAEVWNRGSMSALSMKERCKIFGKENFELVGWFRSLTMQFMKIFSTHSLHY